MDHAFVIRLSTPLSLTKATIVIDGPSLHLLRNSHTSYPIQLVTYLEKRRVYTDGMYGFKTAGHIVVQYNAIRAAGRNHYMVKLRVFSILSASWCGAVEKQLTLVGPKAAQNLCQMRRIWRDWAIDISGY
jgi:hypothetical protein